MVKGRWLEPTLVPGKGRRAPRAPLGTPSPF